MNVIHGVVVFTHAYLQYKIISFVSVVPTKVLATTHNILYLYYFNLYHNVVIRKHQNEFSAKMDAVLEFFTRIG